MNCLSINLSLPILQLAGYECVSDAVIKLTLVLAGLVHNKPTGWRIDYGLRYSKGQPGTDQKLDHCISTVIYCKTLFIQFCKVNGCYFCINLAVPISVDCIKDPGMIRSWGMVSKAWSSMVYKSHQSEWFAFMRHVIAVDWQWKYP